VNPGVCVWRLQGPQQQRMAPGGQGYGDAKAMQQRAAAEAEEEDALLSEVTSLKT
jgi:hypothetical protein